jgi:small multidrug resistance pump
MFAGILLTLAIAVEVASSALLPKAKGFTDVPWTIAVMSGYAVAIWLLTIVVKTVPVSVAYAIWAGAGTALVAVVGYLFLGESMSWIKFVSLTMIVAGVIGLNLTGAH